MITVKHDGSKSATASGYFLWTKIVKAMKELSESTKNLQTRVKTFVLNCSNSNLDCDSSSDCYLFNQTRAYV